MKQLNNLAIVGIDLETTGLDPEKGEIIEVALVKYSFLENSKSEYRNPKQAPISKLVKLCKPSKLISAEITALTGITNEMVVDAPTFAEIIAELQDFIGDSLLFAHNASFDTKWLACHGLSLENNKVWDTFYIASMAWPEAESYNLATLVKAQCPNPNDQSSPNDSMTKNALTRTEHSAEYDVEMAWGVLRAAQKELTATPTTYKRIRELLERAGLGHYGPLFSTSTQQFFRQSGGPADVAGSQFSSTHTKEAFQAALTEGGVALIEAAPDADRRAGYLTPTLLRTPETSGRTVISTSTPQGQHRLVRQDIPRLQTALGTNRTVALLKNRRAYVCRARLGVALERAHVSAAEAFLLIKVLLWLDRGGSGDMDDLNISHQENSLVDCLHADSRLCRQTCGREANTTCPYEQAQGRAQAADILVIHHALLADPAFASDWNVGTLIVDEAHHLASSLRRASSMALRSAELERIMQPLRLAGGHLTLESGEAMGLYRELLASLAAFMQHHTTQKNLRLTPQVRSSTSWGVVEKKAALWLAKMSFISGLVEASSASEETFQFGDTLDEMHHFSAALQRFMVGSTDRIQWLAVPIAAVYMKPGADPVQLHDVIVDIRPVMAALQKAIPRIILTSATLTVNGDFSYSKNLLGISSARELRLPATPALADTLLIYLVDDAPAPAAHTYEHYIARQIEAIALLLGGRTMGLCTSLSSLKAVFQLLVRPLNKATIKLYGEGMTGGRSNMLRRFQDGTKSVLLGGKRFWEGVAISGDTLSCVVIPKLPFGLPHDPVTESVAEAQRLSAFNDLALPEMILQLRQGINRLVRAGTDRAVVVILDSRSIHAGYADAVLGSLPAARIKTGSTADLAPTITKWMGEEGLECWKQE